MSRATRWIPLAKVARPHGVRGELRLDLYNRESDFLLDCDEVLVRLKGGEEHEVSVDRARRADKAILLKLHSVDDRDRAEALRGAELCVRRDAFPPLEEGEFYACDIEGAEVRLHDARLGVVERFVEYPAAFALLVRKDDGTSVEVPLTDAYVGAVDATQGVVLLATLEGL